jgi:hypothetical protein
LNSSATDKALARVSAVFPSLAEAPIRLIRGGVVVTTPDGGYLIDEVPGVEGLLFAGGCNVRGLSASPALGEGIAEWVRSGRKPEAIAKYGLARFADGAHATPRQIEDALAYYEAIYRDDESSERVRADFNGPQARVSTAQGVRP